MSNGPVSLHNAQIVDSRDPDHPVIAHRVDLVQGGIVIYPAPGVTAVGRMFLPHWMVISVMELSTETLMSSPLIPGKN